MIQRIFRRKIYDKILKWKEENQGKTALLIEGARRVGKSTVVEEFAAEAETAVVEPDVLTSLTANDDAIPVEDSNTATLSNVTATLSNLLLIIVKPPLFPICRLHAIRISTEHCIRLS